MTGASHVNWVRPLFEAVDGFEAAHVVRTGEREVGPVIASTSCAG